MTDSSTDSSINSSGGPSGRGFSLLDAGIAPGLLPGLLRCSVGLEDADDLLEDFAQALAVARSASEQVPTKVGAS